MKLVALSFAPVLSVAAADSRTRGYVHRSEAVTVMIEVWAHQPRMPDKGEHLRLPLRIERGARFATVAHFFISAGYKRTEEEAKKKNLQLPDIRLMGITTVYRREN